MANDGQNFWWSINRGLPSPVRYDPRASDTKSNVLIGIIRSVNNERMSCQVDFIYPRIGLIPEVQMGFPFMTRRGFLGGMPEVGTKVIVMAIPESDTSNKYIITGFLPSSPPVLGYNHDRIDVTGEQQPGFRETENEVRLKNQRLYPGEIFLSSDQGSDIRLDEDISFTSNKLNEIILRNSDQSIVLNSLQYYRATDASIRVDGMITRYVESNFNEKGQLLDKDGNVHDAFGIAPSVDKPRRLNYLGSKIDPYTSLITPDLSQNFHMLDDGNYQWVRTLGGTFTIDDPYLIEIDSSDLEVFIAAKKEIEYSALPLTESRFAIRELGDAQLNHSYPFVNDDTETKFEADNPSSRNLIEGVQGTLVGYDFLADPENYGKVLRHQLFRDSDTTVVDSQEIAIEGDLLPHFPNTRTWAVASMWKMPSELTQTRFYVNKEGYISFHVGSTRPQREHVYRQYLSGSTETEAGAINPVGAGRSVEGSFGGSIRLVVEKDYKEESLELTALGRSFINLGCDDRTAATSNRTQARLDGSSVNVGVSSFFDLENEQSQRVSLDMTTDGGLIMRIGKTSKNFKRNHRHNGYNAKGNLFDPSVATAKNLNKSNSFYGPGDLNYRFHDMRLMSIPNAYRASVGSVISDPDLIAGSLDAHLVSDAVVRIGSDGIDNRSLTLDLAGAIVAAIGKDAKGSRSIQALLDGGIELDVGRIKDTGNAIQGILRGDIDLIIKPSNTHPNNKTGSTSPMSHGEKSSYGTTTSGYRDRLHKGKLRYTIDGSHVSRINGDKSLAVAGTLNRTVSGDMDTHTQGAYKLFIGNKNVALNSSSYDISCFAGSMTMQTNIGNLKFETKAGNIYHTTAVGEVKTSILGAGNMGEYIYGAGNIENRTTLGNVTYESLLGSATIGTKAGDTKVYTNFGNVLVATDTGIATLRGLIKAEVIALQKVLIKGLETVVESPSIKFGGDMAIEPVPLGNQLLMWLATHVHGTPGTPPVTPPTPALLSIVSKTL
jgi:hypothetical protein